MNRAISGNTPSCSDPLTSNESALLGALEAGYGAIFAVRKEVLGALLADFGAQDKGVSANLD
jgi:hypothetical protein